MGIVLQEKQPPLTVYDEKRIGIVKHFCLFIRLRLPIVHGRQIESDHCHPAEPVIPVIRRRAAKAHTTAVQIAIYIGKYKISSLFGLFVPGAGSRVKRQWPAFRRQMLVRLRIGGNIKALFIPQRDYRPFTGILRQADHKRRHIGHQPDIIFQPVVVGIGSKLKLRCDDPRIFRPGEINTMGRVIIGIVKHMAYPSGQKNCAVFQPFELRVKYFCPFPGQKGNSFSLCGF